MRSTGGADEALERHLAALRAGDRGAIARAISAVENGSAAGEALWRAAAGPARARVVGITGAPGAGKSTLIDALLGEHLKRGERVAVVAVDPSSPVTGGAVLGDRVRMASHAADPRVFIRSLAARGHLGGLSRSTARIVDLLDAAGFDAVIVETVGTGQSEVEIGALAATRVVVCPPGLGDEVQAIKAGILEIADVLVVNKADSPLAARTARELAEMLTLRRQGAAPVAVVQTVATTGAGVAELMQAIDAHAATGRRGAAAAAPTADAVAAVDAAIGTRRSVRAFLPTPVARATVEEILAVASRAPSGTNTQPWHAEVLAGRRLQALSQAILHAHHHRRGEHHEERPYYPLRWIEPYLGRRRKIGRDLYGLLGIGRDDTERMQRQWDRNYVFFGAPVGIIFSIDRVLELGSWIDYGMFLQNVMVAARARGLDTCPQAAFRPFHALIAEWLELPAGHTVVCGMSLGHADPQAPENALRTEREPVSGFARFHGFDEDPQA